MARKYKTPLGSVSVDPIKMLTNLVKKQLKLGNKAGDRIAQETSKKAARAGFAPPPKPRMLRAGKTQIVSGGNFTMGKARLSASKKRVRKNVYDRLNTKSMTMQYVSCNEFEAPAGKVSFIHNSASGASPIHLIDLTGIYNNGINPSGLREYNRLTSDPFQNSPTGANSNWFRVQSQNPQPGANGYEIDRAIFKSLSAKILLRGCASRAMRYRVMLFKIRDEDMQLYDRSFVERELTNVTHYWDRQLAQWTQNPVRQLVNGSSYKNPIKMIWQKDYIIQEQSADFDKREKRMIKITRDFNELKDFGIDTSNITAFNPLGENTEGVATDEGYTASAYCRPRQRVYLGIIAQETLDASALNNELGELDRPSYDIDIVTRWDIASA